MRRFREDFPSLLNSFNLTTLESDRNAIYALSSELALIYLNPAWFEFARQNEGEPGISEKYLLGTHIGDAMAGTAREYYLETFERILRTGEVWHHDYECSSPEVFRLYHQGVYPFYNKSGLIIVNSLVQQQPHDEISRKSCPPIPELYTQESGFITQCSNCRRVQRAPQQDVWDWVPAWIKRMPENTSHTFCQICYEYYYEFRYPQR